MKTMLAVALDWLKVKGSEPVERQALDRISRTVLIRHAAQAPRLARAVKRLSVKA